MVVLSSVEGYDHGGSEQDKAQAKGSSCHPLMAKVQTNYELLENPAGLRLRKMLCWLPQDVLVQIAPLGCLHYYCQVLLCQEHLGTHSIVNRGLR